MARLTEDTGGSKKLTQAQVNAAANVAVAQTKLNEAKLSNSVPAVVAASKELSQAERTLTQVDKAAELGVDITGATPTQVASTLRTTAYRQAQESAMGEKPEAPPADENYTYEYVWRQDVGGPGGRWVLTKTPVVKTVTKTTTKTTDGTVVTTDGTVVTSDGNTKPVDPLAKLRSEKPELLDAFKLLEDVFTGYGLQSLIPDIRNYMLNNIGPKEAALLLKSTKAYQERFKGNDIRLARGLNVYSEAEYLAHEDEYSGLFRQYGVPQFANKAEYAQLIGNDITKVDLNERLKLAVVNTQNADPYIKAQLKTFYPAITDADLVAYFLKPDETLANLQLKVSSASIAAAAQAQGLQLTGVGTEAQRARAEQLATVLGPSSPEDVLAAARKGFKNVAAVLPFAQKYSYIYGAQTAGYAQTEAEQEFLLGSEAEARKRAGLTALEEAQFQGRSGISTEVNPLGRSIQGTF